MVTVRKTILVFLLLIITACSKQQYYEGLKAGRKSSCLQYPESEYKDCVDETETSYEEYKQQREQAIGNERVD